MRTIVVLCAVATIGAAWSASGCASKAPTSYFVPDAGVVSDAGAPGTGQYDDASFVFTEASLIGIGTVPDGAAPGMPGQTVSAAHVVPANAMLTVNAGSQVTQAYRVMGVLDGVGPEVDVTTRFVFYVPDNYLVGGFPANGGPTFTSRLPSTPADPPQQGGTLTVQAQAANPGGALVTATTSLTVQLLANLTDPNASPNTPAVPANPQGLFGNASDAGASDAGGSASPDPARAPLVYYPNDGAMLPPNLKQLEVHWKPGSAQNSLFRVSFDSGSATITYYVRCNSASIPTQGLAAGACALHLDPTGYGYLAQSNAGHGNVALTVAGTDDTGSAYGVSTTTNIQFAQEPVNGGVYYWDVTHTRIMRFDFGGTQTIPDVFIAPKDYGTNGSCIGCHSLSHDGTKIAASQNGQGGGQLIYVNDIGKATTPAAPARTDPTYLTQNNDSNDHIQFASFNPAGDQFVAVYGDTNTTSGGADAGAEAGADAGADARADTGAGAGTFLDRNKLWFHDGTTGAIIAGAQKQLSFEPDHPSWSPDGTMIAMTHVGSHGTSQREYSGGIDVAAFANGLLADPFVVIPSLVPGTNTYNPDFVPDSSFFVFSQSTCPVGQERTAQCDSDVAGNLNASTWAARPVPNATPVHLDKAGQPGLADNGAVPIDTFPRSTPFKTVQGAGRLFWFTVASQRQPGLRQKTGATQQLLWMFAVDPSRVIAGQDGSFPGFFLPFQDLSTSNHIAQWTQKIVTTTPPPAPPPPPPPPPPPLPPIPQ